jgi:hypothetical protein
MHKLLAAIVASTFALGTVSGFAADAVKRDELTQEQRADMRNRADQLTRARATGTEQQVSARTQHAPAAKKVHHTGKVKKVSKHTVNKAHPKS